MKDIENIENLIGVIIREQEHALGPVAYTIASSVGVVVTNNGVKISGPPKKVLDSLILSYGNMFGEASMDVTRRARAKAGSLKLTR